MADRKKEPKADEEQELRSFLKINIEKIDIETRNVSPRGQFFLLLASLVLLFVLVRLATGTSLISSQLTDLIIAALKLRLGIP